MAPKQKIKISPGDKLGSLTVLSESGRTKDGHLQYFVRCDCGREYLISRGGLLRDNPRCKDCADASGYRKHHEKARLHHLWECVGNWLLLEEPIIGNKGTLIAEAMCLSCGNISVIYPAGAKYRKGFRCSKCPPCYFFKINDGVARGVLPDGSIFIIDAEDIPVVSKYWWHKDDAGYIISSNDRPTLRLHNVVMNFVPSKHKGFFIDHINRDKLNCTKSNLRIVTFQQNSMNKSIQKNSTTGFVGVTFDKHSNKYFARIGLNDKRIRLGSSSDPIVCAQMYNYAATIIFGEFMGHKNDVPDAPDWIKVQVENKCKPYMLEAIIATQSCGISHK